MHNVSRTVRNTKINMCANNLQFLKDKFPCQCASLAPWPEILCLTQRYWVVGCSYTLQLSKLKKLYSEVEKTGSIFCSFTQPCPTLCSPMDCNMLFSLSFHISGVCLYSCLLIQWWHPAILSSVARFSCPQSFPASGSFPVSRLLASGGQSIGAWITFC